jgi:hypothetical protein
MVTQNSIAVTVLQRLAYYDRAPTNTALNFQSNAIAPAGTTVRATYTVPTARKAIITGGSCGVRRRTAATTPAYPNVQLAAPSGFLAQLSTGSNAIDQGADITIASGQVALAGQAIAFQTTDSSTAGTVDFYGVCAILEFDA